MSEKVGCGMGGAYASETGRMASGEIIEVGCSVRRDGQTTPGHLMWVPRLRWILERVCGGKEEKNMNCWLDPRERYEILSPWSCLTQKA